MDEREEFLRDEGLVSETLADSFARDVEEEDRQWRREHPDE